MSTRCLIPHSLTVLSMISCIFFISPETLAQERGKTIGNEFIPADAFATAVVNISDTLAKPKASTYPTEVLDAWCRENTGISAEAIDTIKVVVAMGPAGPMAAAVARLNQEFDPSKLNPDLVNTDDPIIFDGHACFPMNTPVPMVLHQLDKTTIVVANANYLNVILGAGEEDRVLGALAELADRVPQTGQISFLVAMEPIRPMVTRFLQSVASEIPPVVNDLAQITRLLNAIAIDIDLTNDKSVQSLTMMAADDAAAKELEVIYQRSMATGRDMALRVAMADMEDDDPVTIASKHYMNRMADDFVRHITPKRSGHRLTVSGKLTEYMPSMSGHLVGFLASSFQAKRSAARRAVPMNHGREIVLALHNHHDAYQFLPSNILSKDGKPLLSWRVAILPFVDEYDLHERFHLDEPWNSEHNIKLVDQMPRVYRQPHRDLPVGKTVYQRPSGTQLIMHRGRKVRFGDITDGMSNTIIMAEVMPNQAVDWSRPSDLEVHLNEPKAGLCDDSREKMLIIMADGSGFHLPSNIPANTLKRLLTHASGETVDTSGF